MPDNPFLIEKESKDFHPSFEKETVGFTLFPTEHGSSFYCSPMFGERQNGLRITNETGADPTSPFREIIRREDLEYFLNEGNFSFKDIEILKNEFTHTPFPIELAVSENNVVRMNFPEISATASSHKQNVIARCARMNGILSVMTHDASHYAIHTWLHSVNSRPHTLPFFYEEGLISGEFSSSKVVTEEIITTLLQGRYFLKPKDGVIHMMECNKEIHPHLNEVLNPLFHPILSRTGITISLPGLTFWMTTWCKRNLGVINDIARQVVMLDPLLQDIWNKFVEPYMHEEHNSIPKNWYTAMQKGLEILRQDSNYHFKELLKIYDEFRATILKESYGLSDPERYLLRPMYS